MTDVISSVTRIQLEATQTRAPTSEAVAQAMGGSINYLLDVISPVGTVIMSMLTEAQIHTEMGNSKFLLCNGQSCVGTRYETITGNSSVPVSSGRYPRGKDNGSGQDTHGDLPLGSTYVDQFGSHTHGFNYGGSGPIINVLTNLPAAGPTGIVTRQTNANGGAETNPKTVIYNFFIRVD
jgi:hypothetical protein